MKTIENVSVLSPRRSTAAGTATAGSGSRRRSRKGKASSKPLSLSLARDRARDSAACVELKKKVSASADGSSSDAAGRMVAAVLSRLVATATAKVTAMDMAEREMSGTAVVCDRLSSDGGFDAVPFLFKSAATAAAGKKTPVETAVFYNDGGGGGGRSGRTPFIFTETAFAAKTTVPTAVGTSVFYNEVDLSETAPVPFIFRKTAATEPAERRSSQQTVVKKRATVVENPTTVLRTTAPCPPPLPPKPAVFVVRGGGGGGGRFPITTSMSTGSIKDCCPGSGLVPRGDAVGRRRLDGGLKKSPSSSFPAATSAAGPTATTAAAGGVAFKRSTSADLKLKRGVTDGRLQGRGGGGGGGGGACNGKPNLRRVSQLIGFFEKFSTEQVTHSFNENGAPVSESEESDDEEDESGVKNSLAVVPSNGVLLSSSRGARDPPSSSTTSASVPSSKRGVAAAAAAGAAASAGSCELTGGGGGGGGGGGASSSDTLSVAAPSEVDSCTEGGSSPNNSVAALECGADPKREKSYNIAMELLSTEKTYVDVLHLIDRVFYARVEEENVAKPMFPPEVLPQIFSNVRSLYTFHHDFLLPKLRERIEDWDADPRIGDIMKEFAPFLKMYTEYVKNFDSAMNLINALVGKNSRFAGIVEDIQQMPECGNLTLQHHMLSPIQRLPRYQLLLQDYLRRLPDHSCDRDHTEKALHLVSVAATHANDAMRKIDQFKQLLEIQDRLGGVSTIDLVSPSRALVREGRVTKISARSGDHQERYLFLFTDLVLLCSTRPRLPVGSVAQYRLRAQFPMAGLQVLEGDNLETPNTFYLSDGQRTIELYTSSVEEKEAWVSSFVEVIEDLYSRKSSLRLDDGSGGAAVVNSDDDLLDAGGGGGGHFRLCSDDSGVGDSPPTLLRMDGVGKCMDCGSSFTFKRKHHCHACGIIVCSKCSNQRAVLRYNNGKESRICKECYRKLRVAAANITLVVGNHGGADLAGGGGSGGSSNRNSTSTNGSASSSSSLSAASSTSTLMNGKAPSRYSDEDPVVNGGGGGGGGHHHNDRASRRLLEVPANSPCTVSGYLNLKSVRGKTWAKRWFVLHPDGVLFSYKLPSDDRALTATPVPGYNLAYGHGLKGDAMVNEKERDLTFKMYSSSKAYYFQAETKTDLHRWVTELQECVGSEPASTN